MAISTGSAWCRWEVMSFTRVTAAVSGWTVLLALLLPTPAKAEDEELFALYDRAMLIVVKEMTHLHLLDHFPAPVLAQTQVLPEFFGLDRSDPDELNQELGELDSFDGPHVLAELLARGEDLSDDTMEVLGSNVADGAWMDPWIYWDAYYDMIEPWYDNGGFRIDPGFHSFPVNLPCELPADGCPGNWVPPRDRLNGSVDHLHVDSPAELPRDVAGEPIEPLEPSAVAPVERAAAPRWAIGAAGAAVVAVLVAIRAWRAARRERTRRSETEELAFLDELTRVPNRRRFDQDLDRSASAAVGISVAMIDVDHFKNYNDTNGHQRGDEALQQVAALIATNLRIEDMVYRYGGEEFAVILPGADVGEAYAIVERVRLAIESHPFVGGPTQPGGRVTISVGVATAPASAGRSLVEAADVALYRAKDEGRNRVALAAAFSSEP